jgi:FkbM family methyltransferase
MGGDGAMDVATRAAAGLGMKGDDPQVEGGTVVEISHGDVQCRVLVTDPKSSIQKLWLYNHAFYEAEALDLIARFVPPGATILDVGANYGNHTLFFARVLGARRVIPIEPNPKAIAVLRRNLWLNQLENVDLAHLGTAAGARPGYAPLELSNVDEATSNEGGMRVLGASHRQVPVAAIDDLIGDASVNFVKVDVGGMELDVIQGMRRLIERSRPAIFIKLREESVAAFRKWQHDNGYTLCGAVQMSAGMMSLLLVDETSPRALAERNRRLETKIAQLETRLAKLDRPVTAAVASPGTVRRRFLQRQADRVRSRLAPLIGLAFLVSDRLVALALRRYAPAAFVPRHTADMSDAVPTWRPRYDAFTGRGAPPTGLRQAVSVIATTLNERASLAAWLDAMARQTLPPNEIVVVDAGSTDGTTAALREGTAARGLPLTVLEVPGANIAAGRNAAIRAAAHDLIASTDLGCIPTNEWLEHLTAPFVAMPDTAVVAGTTVAGVESDFQAAVAPLFVPYIPEIAPNSFLPSARSIAFTRAAWEAVGGYPEWLTFAGEDTHFAISLRRERMQWVFSPEARVIWTPRHTLAAVKRQVRAYAFGDGEGGMNVAQYREDILAVGSTALLTVGAVGTLLLGAGASIAMGPLALVAAAPFVLLGGLAAIARLWLRCAPYRERRVLDREVARLHRRVLPHVLLQRSLGFLSGHSARLEAGRRRFAGTEGTVVILSGVPFDDSGGGQRPAMLAREFARQKWRVIFVSFYLKYELVHVKVATPADIETFQAQRLDFANPGLDYAYLMEALRRAPRDPDGRPKALCIVEFPEPRFLKLFRAAKAAGVSTVYDCIDLWESSLGDKWFLPTTERQFAVLSDAVIASSSLLLRHAAELGGPRPALVPNAVDTTLFRHARHPPPRDMKRGAPTVIYVGSLWGHWFDWDLLRGIAEALSEASFVIIGDYRGQMEEPPPNIQFLGLKTQAELPAYLANADVGIIPFDVGRLTQAVSPLKVFEYLAMGLPVVATPMAELAHFPHVRLATGSRAFAEEIRAATGSRPTIEHVRNFGRQHNWEARVDALLREVRLGKSDAS